MAEASKPQFSLREVVGTVAPGLMVLLSAFYVAARTGAFADTASRPLPTSSSPPDH
jgi:hypothetical protein